MIIMMLGCAMLTPTYKNGYRKATPQFKNLKYIPNIY